MVVERGECGTPIVAWHFIVHGVPSNLQIHRVATKGFWDCGIVFIVFVIGCSHWFVMGGRCGFKGSKFGSHGGFRALVVNEIDVVAEQT